jgi:hypothetical protein
VDRLVGLEGQASRVGSACGRIPQEAPMKSAPMRRDDPSHRASSADCAVGLARGKPCAPRCRPLRADGRVDLRAPMCEICRLLHVRCIPEGRAGVVPRGCHRHRLRQHVQSMGCVSRAARGFAESSRAERDDRRATMGRATRVRSSSTAPGSTRDCAAARRRAHSTGTRCPGGTSARGCHLVDSPKRL